MALRSYEAGPIDRRRYVANGTFMEIRPLLEAWGVSLPPHADLELPGTGFRCRLDDIGPYLFVEKDHQGQITIEVNIDSTRLYFGRWTDE